MLAYFHILWYVSHPAPWVWFTGWRPGSGDEGNDSLECGWYVVVSLFYFFFTMDHLLIQEALQKTSCPLRTAGGRLWDNVEQRPYFRLVNYYNLPRYYSTFCTANFDLDHSHLIICLLSITNAKVKVMVSLVHYACSKPIQEEAGNSIF